MYYRRKTTVPVLVRAIFNSKKYLCGINFDGVFSIDVGLELFGVAGSVRRAGSMYNL